MCIIVQKLVKIGQTVGEICLFNGLFSRLRSSAILDFLKFEVVSADRDKRVNMHRSDWSNRCRHRHFSIFKMAVM